jgi:hypothetical protein
MGCCHSEPRAVPAPSILNLLPNVDQPSVHSASSPPPSHPHRLIEFGDKGNQWRTMMQVSLELNKHQNSLQIDHHEFYRRPDPRMMKLFTPPILREVEQALVTALANKIWSMTEDSGACLSYNAAQFKYLHMKWSQFSPAIIEAALTHIIENLDKYPKVVAALKTRKIGYHDEGVMLNDAGVRTFIIQGTGGADYAT